MTAAVKRGPGRPAALATGARTSSVTLRLSEAERAAWEAAALTYAIAAGELVTMPEWARRTLCAAASAKRTRGGR